MKGKIDNEGRLFIDRSGVINSRLQLCPYGDEEVPCGDWCPLFGEPFTQDFQLKDQEEDEFIGLTICKRVLSFSKFKDEREG